MVSEFDEASFLDQSSLDVKDCVMSHWFCCADGDVHETSYGELDTTFLSNVDMASPLSRSPNDVGEHVNLHLYDLNDTFGHMNNVAVDLLGFGGALHVGVEVLGNEWSYGMQGVSVTTPKQNQYYTYRQSVHMGRTPLKRREVVSAILALSEEWLGADYDIFAKNCATFSCCLCELLGVGEIPAWVSRLPQVMGKLPAMRALAGAVVRRSVEAELPMDSRQRILSPLAGARLSPLSGMAASHGEAGCKSPLAVRQLMGSPVRVRFSSSPCYRSRPVQERCEAFRVDKAKEENQQQQQQLQNPFGLDLGSMCSSSGELPAVPAKNLMRAPARTSYSIAGA